MKLVVTLKNLKTMKTRLMLLFLMICSLALIGQNQKPTMLQEIKSSPPKFTGIDKTVPILVKEQFPTIEDYLIKNVVYPEEDLKSWVQGTEIVHFDVTPMGAIADIRVMNSVSKRIDDEMIRVLKTTNGMWKPGFNDQNAVTMEKEVAMVFKIGDMPAKYDFNYWARKHYATGSKMLFVNSNPKKAIKHFDNGIVLLPNDKALLVLRGLTRYELGNKEGALKDWTRVKELGGIESKEYLENFNDLKGIAEMRQLLEN